MLDAIPQTDLTILAGDLNAYISADGSGWEEIMGKFGHGEINDNGLCLMSFAAANNFIIGNSHFQHPQKHQLTWWNPSGKDSAILDYILINTRFSSSLKDMQAMRGPDCGSDHYLVWAKVQLRLQWAKCSKMRTPAKMCLTNFIKVNIYGELQEKKGRGKKWIYKYE